MRAEALAARRGVPRAQAEADAVDAYLKHLVATDRMALASRGSTPLQTAKLFGGHKTELEALSAALDFASSASGA